jgi:exopolyphosphatase/guanosine-5'-triphosphate,3'-diphosphate pyrophosphatase
MPTFAAIDIGSNSVRLKIAKTSGNRLHTVHEDREVTRLGESVFRTGSFSPQAMERTITVLRRFHRAVQQFAADRVRVVATSATRDARNAVVFRELVRAATGWRLEIISGLEEGRLIHLGVMSGTRLSGSAALLIDLGGGSCELTFSREHHIEHMVSLPLGAVRLTQEFLEHDPPYSEELTRMRQFIQEELGRMHHHFHAAEIRAVIATSGTAAALHDAWFARSPGKTRTVPASGVRELTAKLERMNIRQRRAVRGIGPRRAEIIIAGASVFAELLTRFRLPSIRYSPLGLRDGMLAQMAADYAPSQQLRTRISVERADAIIAMCRHYRVDMKHAERVRRIVERLFTSLAPVHKLAPHYKNWLSSAAMLHEVGGFINRSGRHRHAYYVIAHSDIFGYTPAERRVIAAIARYVGKTKPQPGDAIIRFAPSGERSNIPAAVALLRLAKALDQSRSGRVLGFTVRRQHNAIKLVLETRGSAELELWAVDKERPYFREIFRLDLLAEGSKFKRSSRSG